MAFQMDYIPHCGIVLFVFACAFASVTASLSPRGPIVSVDCGSQQRFTCTIAGAVALWTISGLDGITEEQAGTTGLALANNNPRITTLDARSVVQSSTIIITDFRAADNGGTVGCVSTADNTLQGVVAVAVGPPHCGQVEVISGCDSCPEYTVATRSSGLPSRIQLAYRLVGDSFVADLLNCSFPYGPRCKLAVPGGTYAVGLTLQNNCGPPVTCPTFTQDIPPNCALACRGLPNPPPSAVLSGVIPSIALILLNTITGVIVFLVTRDNYRTAISKLKTEYENAAMFPTAMSVAAVTGSPLPGETGMPALVDTPGSSEEDGGFVRMTPNPAYAQMEIGAKEPTLHEDAVYVVLEQEMRRAKTTDAR